LNEPKPLCGLRKHAIADADLSRLVHRGISRDIPVSVFVRAGTASRPVDKRRTANSTSRWHSLMHGQGLALEGHSILEALAKRVVRFDVGEGTPFLNNLIHGLESLPVQAVRP
jgi:hypothetical protein